MVSNPKNFDAPKAVIINVAIGSALNEPFHKSIAAFINVSKKLPMELKTLVHSIPFKNSPNFLPNSFQSTF